MEKLKVDMPISEDKEILEKMKIAFENCPSAIRHLNDLKVPPEVIDRNLPKIFDFVSDINYCKNVRELKNVKKKGHC